MFSVIFEVRPAAEQWEAYLGHARMLRPELEGIDGFIDNVRYRSLTREGYLLSLSGWRDEKALVRWRTHAGHHGVQEKGRFGVLADYHLRVGQITRDTQVPEGHALLEQRLDETQTGEATTVTLIGGKAASGSSVAADPLEAAQRLGFVAGADGLVAWDVFDAVLTPGDHILLLAWRDEAAAETFDAPLSLAEGTRRRRVRVVRDYGMYDRREAPQYYPDVEPRRRG